MNRKIHRWDCMCPYSFFSLFWISCCLLADQ